MITRLNELFMALLNNKPQGKWIEETKVEVYDEDTDKVRVLSVRKLDDYTVQLVVSNIPLPAVGDLGLKSFVPGGITPRPGK